MQSEGKRNAAFSRLRRTDMLKFLTSAIGIIFLIGLIVVIGILMLIF